MNFYIVHVQNTSGGFECVYLGSSYIELVTSVTTMA